MGRVRLTRDTSKLHRLLGTKVEIPEDVVPIDAGEWEGDTDLSSPNHIVTPLPEGGRIKNKVLHSIDITSWINPRDMALGLTLEFVFMGEAQITEIAIPMASVRQAAHQANYYVSSAYYELLGHLTEYLEGYGVGVSGLVRTEIRNRIERALAEVLPI